MKRLWNRLLILLRLRPDWDNLPELAPPAFENIKPHVYDPEMPSGVYMNGEWVETIRVLDFCAQCGAGRKHHIHTVVQ